MGHALRLSGTYRPTAQDSAPAAASLLPLNPRVSTSAPLLGGQFVGVVLNLNRVVSTCEGSRRRSRPVLADPSGHQPTHVSLRRRP